MKVVQCRLGHKTAQETLDTHGHLWPDSDDQTRSAVETELFRGLGAGADEDRDAPPLTGDARR